MDWKFSALDESSETSSSTPSLFTEENPKPGQGQEGVIKSKN